VEEACAVPVCAPVGVWPPCAWISAVVWVCATGVSAAASSSPSVFGRVTTGLPVHGSISTAGSFCAAAACCCAAAGTAASMAAASRMIERM
jgi:hypothetical protein